MNRESGLSLSLFASFYLRDIEREEVDNLLNLVRTDSWIENLLLRAKTVCVVPGGTSTYMHVHVDLVLFCTKILMCRIDNVFFLIG